MQSHQDIKANPLDELPADLLLEIAAHLRPEEAAHFFSSSAKFKESFKNRRLGTDSFWKKKLELHFPETFKQIKNTSHTDWQAAFIEADKTHYRGLSPRDKKLFSIVKEGDVNSFIDGQYSLIDLAKTDSDGTHVIHWASKNQHQTMLDHFFKELVLSYYTNTNDSLDLAKRDEYGHSILHWAAYCGQGQDTLVALITAGINVDAASLFGHTPLHAAAYNGHLAIAKHLIEQGANVNAVTSYAGTPLYVAAQNGHLDVVNTLIAHGANVDAASSDGCTPLYVAAHNGHLDVVNTLIAQGANVNTAKLFGSTPLYVAAQNGHLDVVNTLIAHGANVDTAVFWGDTPLHIAVKKGHREVANALCISMLQNYIEARSADTAPEYKRSVNVFGLFSIHPGCSKNEKVAAASMLKCVLQGADPDNLKGHETALTHGDLGKIFSRVEDVFERMNKDALSGFKI